MMNDKVKIVIADDHPIVRQGLRQMIEAERNLTVGEASDGETALQLIETHQPDVAVLDIDMPRIGGFDVVRELERKKIRVKIIFLTMHTEEPVYSYENQANNDGDALSDACDSDDDNDGVNDTDNVFPFNQNESVDTDVDGIGNNADPDDDDGADDAAEATAGSDPLNRNSTPEVCDGGDNDLNEGVDEGFTNTDGDATADCVDLDDDNDGVLDTLDALPFNPNESVDTDSDGTGNNADTDDDGDRVLDA
jgi:CheY-like chemotaxis protein